MTRRRWIADEFSGDVAALTGPNAAHLARVLRARIGQQFDIAVGERIRLGTVRSVSPDRVEFTLGEEVSSGEALPITLYLAIFKFDRMEWAIEKATELGVGSIVPFLARRTEAHLAQSALKRADRWRRIALEASQQARRITPPNVCDPVKLKPALESSQGVRMVLAENERGVTLRELLGSETEYDSLSLAIGPEGGWTEDELGLFDAAEWKRASLGPTILRAETAAIAATAIAASFLF